MSSDRLTAFSDGVIAIIITIMVLELKVPHETDLSALRGLIPVFLSYVLSFIYVAIYWTNHHHMLHTVKEVSGGIMWANTHLLFWLSLVPFATAWTGENRFAAWPTAVYGFTLLMCAAAYSLLQHMIVRRHGEDSLLARAIGHDRKGKLSMALYLSGIAMSFFSPRIAIGFYAFVAAIWLMPNRKIEKRVAEEEAKVEAAK